MLNKTWTIGVNIFNALCNLIPPSLIALSARVSVGWTFLKSGMTRTNDWQFWNVNESSLALFRYEYNVPLLPPEWAAIITSINEHVFSVLLIVGLASRLSAVVFLFMALVIQVFVYPHIWLDHLLWATGLLYILHFGAGKISLDYLWSLRHRTSSPPNQ